MRNAHLLAVVAALLPAGVALPAAAADRYVSDYGAVADDATDDRNAIQAAINAAQPGDRVILDAGTYRLSSSLLVAHKGISFLGQGAGATTLLNTQAITAVSDLTPLLKVFNANGAAVSGLAFDGANLPGVTQGVLVENSSGVQIDAIAVRNLNQSAGTASRFPRSIGVLLWTGVTDTTVRDSGFTNLGNLNGDTWGAGVRVRNSPGNTVAGNAISNVSRGGVFIDESADAVVQGNLIMQTGVAGGEGLGIEIQRSPRTVIEENTVDHWISVVQNSHQTAVRRNSIGFNAGPATFAAMESIGVENVVWTDNVVTDGSSMAIGIFAGGGDKNLFAYNDVDGARDAGAQLQGGNNRQVYYRNTFTNSGNNSGNNLEAGFWTNVGTMRDIVLEGNTISGSSRHGLLFNTGNGQLNLDRFEFYGNTITDNTLRGVEATSGADNTHGSNEWWATDNVVAGNGVNTHNMRRVGFANDRPFAAILAPTTALAGEEVDFSMLFSDADGILGAVLWDLGVGTPATTTSPTAVYDEPGEYRVLMVAWDDDGRASGVAEHVITVVPEPAGVGLLAAPLVLALRRRRR